MLTWLVPPLASLWWTVPIVVVVVVEVGAVFTGFGAIVPRMSIITTNFTHEVRTHGVNGSMDLLFAPLGEMNRTPAPPPSSLSELSKYITQCSNTRFIKGHKPSNHIHARIKSHVYTIEWTVYHSTYHVKRHNKANTNVIYYIKDKMSDTAEAKYKIR